MHTFNIVNRDDNRRISDFSLNLLYFLFLSTMFLPWITIFESAPLLRPEWIVVAFFAILYPHRFIADKRIYFSFGALFLCMCISMIWGELVPGADFTIPDIFELLKPFLYALFYMFVISIDVSTKNLEKVQRKILLMFTVAAFIAIIQYFAPEIIRPFLKLYAGEDRIDIYKTSRATGTMGNANDLGMLFVLGSGLSFFTLRQKLFPPIRSIVVSVIQVLGVFASGSRTASVALLCILLYFFYINAFKYKSFKNTVIIMIFILIAGVVIAQYADILYQSINRYAVFSDVEEDTAFALRMEGMFDTLHLIRNSIFFGWGPNKEGFIWGNNVDNEYILFLYRYGISGLLVLIILFYNMWKLGKTKKKSSLLIYNSYHYFLTSIMFGSMIFAFTAGIFQQFRLMTLIILFLSIGNTVARNVNSQIEKYDENGSVT
jgi:O-Antigen ligase